MLETRHHWLPVFIAIYLPVSFIITYSIAVGNDHVEPAFPYISDTGTKSPESCVFGQLLNIGAVISGIIVYVRYRHIHTHFMNKPGKKNLLRLNNAGFICGMLANLGVSLVGNFQETNIIVVHLIGAFLAFGVGFVYMILQTIMSYKTVGDVAIRGSTVFLRRFRVVLCLVDVIFLIILSIAARIAMSKGPGEGKSKQKWSADEPSLVIVATGVASIKHNGFGELELKWSSSDPGYAEHVVATSSEWLVAFVTVAFFASFYSEFKHFRMKPPEVEYYEALAPETGDEQRQGTPITTISGDKIA